MHKLLAKTKINNFRSHPTNTLFKQLLTYMEIVNIM